MQAQVVFYYLYCRNNSETGKLKLYIYSMLRVTAIESAPRRQLFAIFSIVRLAGCLQIIMLIRAVALSLVNVYFFRKCTKLLRATNRICLGENEMTSVCESVYIIF